MAEFLSDDKLEKIMLYVLGTCHDLKRNGIVAGKFDLTESGYQAFKELKRKGFRPTTDEIEMMMDFLQGQAENPDAEAT